MYYNAAIASWFSAAFNVHYLRDQHGNHVRLGAPLGPQRFQQGFGLLEVCRVKALGEPAVDLRQQLAGLFALPLTLSEPREAQRGAPTPSPAADAPRPALDENSLPPGPHRGAGVGAARPPGADTARPPISAPRSRSPASRLPPRRSDHLVAAPQAHLWRLQTEGAKNDLVLLCHRISRRCNLNSL
jgi:hypothetical protein